MKRVKLFEEFITEKRGLWDNVWAKRKRGEKPAKPGDEDYPDEDAWDAAQESEVLESEDTYSDYPKAASANAKKALDWRDEYGRDEVDAGTAVGWQRANQLAKGEAVSRDVVSRMAQFNRHRKNSTIDPKFKDTPWKDRGYVAWLIWGGDEGVDWAMKKMDQIKKEEVVREDVVSFIKNVADKAKSLVDKTVSLNKKTDTIKKKAERAKQKKTPEGNLEVALTNNQLQQAKVDSQKIKLQQVELKIKQQIEKTKEAEARQKEKQGQQPRVESVNTPKHIQLFEDFVNESNSNESFEYKGYFCNIVKKNENEDLWHCSIYKGTKVDENNYVMGIKGLLPLEEAIDTAKRYVDEKMNEESISEAVKGAEVWKHIVSITPEKDMIPTGFKKDIVKRSFKNVDNFDIKSLLKTDADFKEYYKSGEVRYDEDDVNPRDISNEIVVVDGTLLDGYSRVSALLKNGEKTTNAYVAEKMNEDVGQIFSDGMDQTLRTGYKVELMTGDTGVIIDLIGTDEAIVLLGNGVTARVNPQSEIKQIIDTTEPTKSNGRFMS